MCIDAASLCEHLRLSLQRAYSTMVRAPQGGTTNAIMCSHLAASAGQTPTFGFTFADAESLRPDVLAR